MDRRVPQRVPQQGEPPSIPHARSSGASRCLAGLRGTGVPDAHGRATQVAPSAHPASGGAAGCLRQSACVLRGRVRVFCALECSCARAQTQTCADPAQKSSRGDTSGRLRRRQLSKPPFRFLQVAKTTRKCVVDALFARKWLVFGARFMKSALVFCIRQSAHAPLCIL